MNQARSTTSRTVTRPEPVQVAAAMFGIVFLVAGILGFIPGITTDYDRMTLAGSVSGARLLGLFSVSILHNVVHLVFGAAGLPMARTPHGPRMFLIYAGVVYLALWIYGLMIDQSSSVNFVPVNTADNWLHLGLALSMVTLGVLLGRNCSGASGRT